MKSLLTLLSLAFISFQTIAQAEGFAESKNVDIFYQTFGEGEPLVIINGGPGFPSNHFVKIAQKLSEAGRQTIIFDQRGTGRSEMDFINGYTVTLNNMVEDMEALRKHLGIDKWTIMGHSFGGMYAMYYATKHPDMIKGMILSHSGGIDLEFANTFVANRSIRLTPTEQDSLNYWSRATNIAQHPNYARIGLVKAMAPSYVFDRSNIPDVVEGMTKSKFEPRINSLIWNELYRMNFDLREDLNDFEQPVLIVGGKQDLVGESTAYEIHMALQNSQLELINECGHYGWLDQPEKYFKIVEHFLVGLGNGKMVTN